jgi:hypothetical protein
MPSPQMYYNPQSRNFTTASGPGLIPIPARVHRQIMEDLRAGKAVVVAGAGIPVAGAALLTLSGMRDAVLTELREQRAPVLNALNGVWIDAHTEADAVLQAEVIAARDFLKNMPQDPDVLAVTVEQGAEYMRQLVLAKYKAHAYAASAAVRNAFKEVS